MTIDLSNDSDYFLELQTRTGWGRVLQRFVEWIDPQPGWRTLDAGCGPGLLPLLINERGCQSTGIDIDPAMFEPAPLHPDVVIGAVDALPYPEACFDLVTCSNLLFLNPHSIRVLRNLQRLLLPGGQLAMINPSEKLSTDAASQLADSAGLTGLARDSLLNFAGRAERHRRWTESETGELIKASGLAIIDTKLTMGPGFARFTRAQKQRSKQYASL